MIGMLDYHPMRRLNGTRRDHDHVVRTICQECAVGCGLCAYVSEGRLVDVQGDDKNPVNVGRLCARGTAFVRDLYNKERIAVPADRKSLKDNFEELGSWDEALDLLADRLKRIRDQYGPETLYIGCDLAAGLDFYFGAKRFAALWGSPHVFSPLDHLPESCVPGVHNAPDSGCRDWIHSRCLFIVGADPASTHPVAFRWVIEAQKRGATVVVADTRFTKSMSKADVALRIRSDTANILGTVIMKAILDDDLCGLDSIRDRLTVTESWEDSLGRISLEAAAKTIGLSSRKLRETAFLLSKTGPVQVITGRRLAQSGGYGIWRTIAAVMGWTGKKGGGWYPLDSGWPPVSSAKDLQASNVEGVVEKLHADSPVSLDDLLAKMTIGQTDPPRAIISSGNCLDDFGLQLTPGNEDTPLTSYFGLVFNGTARVSNMVFPAQAWAERDGLFFSNDRAILWGRKIVEAPHAARSGLEFWMGLAKRFGWEDRYPWQSNDGEADLEGFFDWLLNQNPATEGCNADILRKATDRGEFVFWPFEVNQSSETHFTSRAETSENIALTPATALENLPDESEELYPLHLEVPDAVSKTVFVLDSGELKNARVLQINPEVADALGIQTGGKVVVRWPAGSLEARAWITRMVPRWLVYLQHGLNQKRVLVCKKGQSSQQALNILKGLLS
jgi:formate dehydrogenase major subunit